MVRPFESYVDESQVERVLELSVRCTEDSTLDVTDLDLVPVGHSTVPVTRRLRDKCVGGLCVCRGGACGEPGRGVHRHLHVNS